MISPLIRHELPVSLPQTPTSPCPQTQSEYAIVRFTCSKASRIILYRRAVFELRQS